MAQEIAPFLKEQLLAQYGEDVTARIVEGYAQRRMATPSSKWTPEKMARVLMI